MSSIVSVVIPTHNRAAFLGAAIHSVLGQSVSAEVVVVDDGSTDDTPEVLAGFGDDISVVRVDNSIERGAARNLGAGRTTGDFLAFLDSDDVWEPDKLALQLEVADGRKAVLTAVKEIDRSGALRGRTRRPRPRPETRLHLENPFAAVPSCILVSRALFNDAGGFPEALDVQGSEDWLFVLRLHSLGCRFELVPRPLVGYRVHSGNSTSNIDRVASCMWAATRLATEEGLVTSEQSVRMRARTAGVIARQFARAGRWGDSMDWLRRAAQHSFSEAVGAGALSALSGAMRAITRDGRG